LSNLKVNLLVKVLRHKFFFLARKQVSICSLEIIKQSIKKLKCCSDVIPHSEGKTHVQLCIEPPDLYPVTSSHESQEIMAHKNNGEAGKKEKFLV